MISSISKRFIQRTIYIVQCLSLFIYSALSGYNILFTISIACLSILLYFPYNQWVGNQNDIDISVDDVDKLNNTLDILKNYTNIAVVDAISKFANGLAKRTTCPNCKSNMNFVWVKGSENGKQESYYMLYCYNCTHVIGKETDIKNVYKLFDFRV